jgi:hypothetical protein
MNFDALIGLGVTALYHPLRANGVGLTHLDLTTTDHRRFRISTELLDGEFGDGYSNEHFSLILDQVDQADAEGTPTMLQGNVVAVERIFCDEWLGPVDDSLDSIGVNPRSLFDGKVGSAPPGAQPKTVLCGALVRSDTWKLLVFTHAFPANIEFTLDETAIAEFVDLYSPFGLESMGLN